MKVYLCQRDDECSDCCGLSAFAVCSTLEKCKDECVKNVKEGNKDMKGFNIDDCIIGEIKNGYASDLKELEIIDNTLCQYSHRYEIWEMDVI